MISTLQEEAIPDNWNIYRFDQIFKRVERKIIIDDTITYECVGVRWYGMGAFIREKKPGLNINRKQQWIVKIDDVIYNKLFAWKGSFAVADNTVDNCIVSDKFPTYRANADVVDLKFLRYFFQTEKVASQALNFSKGGAAISKLTLNPPQFWDLTIPLPPLEEQHRIVACVEALERKVIKVRNLQREVEAELQALMTSFISKIFGGIPIKGKLEDILLSNPQNGWSARCDNMDTGVPVLSLGAVTGFRYKETEYKKTSEITTEAAHYWLKPGDLLMTRSNTPEFVGHAAIYNGNPSPCIYPDLMMRLDVNEALADKYFVHCWLRSNQVREYIKKFAKGTSSSMVKISQKTVMNVPYPSQIPKEQQQHIVGQIHTLEKLYQSSVSYKAESTAELDALLPSILDKAFKGEL